jgi:2-oxoglutarate ferredoxin oxidoreductase subunit beta
MSTIQDFTGYTPTWCAGCGNWGIGRSVMQALTESGLSPDQICIMFDIGCSGNTNDFINAYAMHTLHGRSIPAGIGVKLANHDLPVLIMGGDGSLYGEGGNHFLHACRANHDITVIVHDNSVYGLTKGQASPMADKGYKTKTSPPDGTIETPINPLVLAISQGASFVAQTFAGNVPHLVQTIKDGLAHKGFSLINILQPCVTFNKVNTYGYYFQKSYQLKEHDPTNLTAALQLAMQPEQEEKFPLGIIYKVDKPAFHEQLPQLATQTLIKKSSQQLSNEILNLYR